MKTRRKLELVVNGKYNMKAIMKKAWMYKNNPFCTQYRNDFKGALKEAWVDARLAMDKYKLAEEYESKMKAMKATRKNEECSSCGERKITWSDCYNVNSRGYLGSQYCGD